MKKADRESFFQRLKAHDPEPTTELEYETPFELLVAVILFCFVYAVRTILAVILSAQATDVGVNKATRRLFPVANTPQAILDLGLDGLKERIRTIGLFNAKAANIVKTCRLLLEHHGGEVPDTRAALEALPGVGRKTANAVDTHIFRVSNRTGLALGKTPLEVERKLLKSVPKAYLQDAHHWLILHGRYTCTARKPRCDECIVADLCREGRRGTWRSCGA